MTQKLQETIKEEIMKLPREAEEAISAFGWEKIAEEIGKKYLLDEDEINNFQLETLLVLIGAVDPEFYAVNIENHAGATKSDAEKMAEEARNKIFAPVSDAITENIKKNLKNKNPSVEQTLNFILSGGNYAALIAPRPLSPERKGGGQAANPPLLGQGGVRGGNSITTSPQRGTPPPQGGEGTSTNGLKKNIPKKPKMNDLKSQFRI